MKQLTLKTTTNYSFVLLATNEERIKHTDKLLEIKEREGKDKILKEENDFLDSIYAYGDINSVDANNAKMFIPIYKTHNDKEKEKNKIIEYKCYQGQSKVEHNVILHEDALSSLKCACELLGTKHFFIIKQDNNDQDNNRNTEFCKETPSIEEAES